MGRHSRTDEPHPAAGDDNDDDATSSRAPSRAGSRVASRRASRQTLRTASPAPAAGVTRGPRLAAVALVWVVGLVVGFFGMLSVAARFGCGPTQSGLACGSGGTALGVVITIAVVVVVTTVTLLTFGRSPRWLAVCTVAGLVALGLCYLAAQGLLDTA